MSQTIRPCPECGEEIKSREKVCPHCGEDCSAKFTFRPGEIIVSDTKGKEIALSIDSQDSYVLRIKGRPTVFLKGFKEVLKEIFESGIRAPSDSISSLERIVDIVTVQADYMTVVAYKLEKELKKGGAS
jgi:RNA polymerase subunit RPABC4/transcription elongation factor Spt4